VYSRSCPVSLHDRGKEVNERPSAKGKRGRKKKRRKKRKTLARPNCMPVSEARS